MNIKLEPGKYIVAVSGGVDSMSLLHALKACPDVEVVVAHFDHGIRADSSEDARLVTVVAQEQGLLYEIGKGRLGSNASEAEARKARYEFLQSIREHHAARAIVTAHHQDDVLETAILNLLRGTGRKGLSSLASRKGLERPLLDVSKAEIIAYAQAHKLRWREDSTNGSDRYARNYVRQHLLPRFTAQDKTALLKVVKRSHETNQALDDAILQILDASNPDILDRHTFIMLPHTAAREVMASWLRTHDVREFDKPTIERLVVAAKTGRAKSSINIYGKHMLVVDKHKLALATRDR